MRSFYLLSIILGLSFQNVTQKAYAGKTTGKGQYFFSFLVSLSAMLFFIISSGSFSWNGGIVIYAIFFAISYTTSTVFGLCAFSHGSLSLTSLILSYSLILPTVYGLFFLNEPFNLKIGIGFLFLVISLFLINQKNSKVPITFKWVVFVILAFVGNGMCSVFQKMQQVAFEGAYKNEFMIVALAFVTVLISFFVFKKERREVKEYAKTGWYMPVACGLANGVVNLFVMVLSNLMPVSVMFPMISAGGIIITYIISRFYYKEKLTRVQFLGFLIGILSVIFIS